MNYSDYFKDELKNPKTNYFILDSKGDASIGDIDFEKYSWHRSKYNRVNESDLVILEDLEKRLKQTNSISMVPQKLVSYLVQIELLHN